jgi:hypothetical protein
MVDNLEVDTAEGKRVQTSFIINRVFVFLVGVLRHRRQRHHRQDVT